LTMISMVTRTLCLSNIFMENELSANPQTCKLMIRLDGRAKIIFYDAYRWQNIYVINA